MISSYEDLVSTFSNFENLSLEAKFTFVSDYLMYIEQVSTFTDPLKNNMSIEKACYDFLLHMVSDSKKIHTNTPASLAHAYLGMVYEIGCFNIERNVNQALLWYIAASKQNNALGSFRLAQVFEKHRNMEKALVYYRLATKLGSVEASHTYGIILMNGSGVEKNVTAGMIYLKRAAMSATKKYPYALYDLAKIYEQTDPDYSFELYNKGADLGDPNSMLVMAQTYENGDFAQIRDLDRAYEYYESAAKHGQIDAMFILAMRLEDSTTAYEMSLNAAARGHAGAAELLGDFLERGLGTEKDAVYALWWYVVARELGNKNCEDKIEKLREHAHGNIHVRVGKRGCSLI